MHAEVTARPRLARFAIRHSDRIVAVSHYTTTLAAAAGADLDRVTVISPGIDSPSHADRAAAVDPTIVTVARIEEATKATT